MTQAGVSHPIYLPFWLERNHGCLLLFFFKPRIAHYLLSDTSYYLTKTTSIQRGKTTTPKAYQRTSIFTSICKRLSLASLLSAGFSPHAGWCGQNCSHGPCCSQQGGLRSWFTLYFLPFVCSSWSINSKRQELQLERNSMVSLSPSIFSSLLCFISAIIIAIAAERRNNAKDTSAL